MERPDLTRIAGSDYQLDAVAADTPQITHRPEFVAPWVGSSYVTLLALNRLPRWKWVELIAAVTGGKALTKEIVDQIVDRTDGVPLFIEEMTKAIIEGGTVDDEDDLYTLGGR